MTICAFCPNDKEELYTCPKCRANYCSIKCYRSNEHNVCSEEFYKKCVKQQLQGKMNTNPLSTNFEEDMKKYIKGESDHLPGTSNQEEGERIDSDDETCEEEENYIKKVVTDTVINYDQDDNEIERQLLALGLGSDLEQLMSSLSEEERNAFAQLAEEMHNEELGLDESCFKKS